MRPTRVRIRRIVVDSGASPNFDRTALTLSEQLRDLIKSLLGDDAEVELATTGKENVGHVDTLHIDVVLWGDVLNTVRVGELRRAIGRWWGSTETRTRAVLMEYGNVPASLGMRAACEEAVAFHYPLTPVANEPAAAQ